MGAESINSDLFQHDDSKMELVLLGLHFIDTRMGRRKRGKAGRLEEVSGWDRQEQGNEFSLLKGPEGLKMPCQEVVRHL